MLSCLAGAAHRRLVFTAEAMVITRAEGVVFSTKGVATFESTAFFADKRQSVT
jgi:hypothetical protein